LILATDGSFQRVAPLSTAHCMVGMRVRTAFFQSPLLWHQEETDVPGDSTLIFGRGGRGLTAKTKDELDGIALTRVFLGIVSNRYNKPNGPNLDRVRKCCKVGSYLEQ
jgi:hypothetical protein